MRTIDTLRLFAEADDKWIGVIFATGRVSYIINAVICDKDNRTTLLVSKMSKLGKVSKTKIQYPDLEKFKTIVIY